MNTIFILSKDEKVLKNALSFLSMQPNLFILYILDDCCYDIDNIVNNGITGAIARGDTTLVIINSELINCIDHLKDIDSSKILCFTRNISDNWDYYSLFDKLEKQNPEQYISMFDLSLKTDSGQRSILKHINIPDTDWIIEPTIKSVFVTSSVEIKAISKFDFINRIKNDE